MSKCLSCRRRGLGRAAVFLVAAIAVLAGGCGGGGGGSTTDAEKAADAEILNAILARELTTIDSYARSLPLLHGEALAIGRQLRGQDQAHVDALTKAIRGLGGETVAEASEPEDPDPRSQAEALTLFYEGENAALGEVLDAASHLQTPAPLTLAAALGASHAQHLVLLRQAMGVGLAAAAPASFEPGDAPPPVADEPGASK